MKKIYELVFITENNQENNLLFSNKRKAEKELIEFYHEGAYFASEKIINSFICERKLF